jgi:methionyl aminopeptidase
MIFIKNEAEIEKMRTAGKIAAGICDRVIKFIKPGISTAEIDCYATGLMKEQDVESAFLGYRGFPGSICISINEEVVHGVPGQRCVSSGDIVSIDIGIVKDSYYSDMAKTIIIGDVSAQARKLVNTAEKALYAGIGKAVTGNNLSDISHAIELCVLNAGFSVVHQFVGHGIGLSMHEDPQILNFGPPGKGVLLKKGMTFAIEPMVNMGNAEVMVMEDGWTAVTCDRKPSAHFEHTVAVGDGTAEILTLK